MRQITVGLLLLGAMIGFIAPSGATEPLMPVQAQGQAPNQGRAGGRTRLRLSLSNRSVLSATFIGWAASMAPI